MNAERLLALYEQVAEAPDAVPRLRRFVLDLAVRGKLVPQDGGDEPASELLKRIAAEKARLVKVGEIRNKPDLPAVETSHQPNPIPSNWKWIRFGNIVDFSAGRTPSRNETSFWNSGDYPWVSIADMAEGQVVESTKETVSEMARKAVFKSEPEPAGTMIMSFKLTIGKIARLGIPAFHNEAIISIRPHLADLDPFLFKVLPDLARGGDTKGAIKGATLNRESISNILIPLPPLAEQRRIVAKVEELMALLDRLEAARTTREATRDRLTAASLARLTAASLARLTAPETDPADFPANAHFAFATLPALTTRPDQLKPLRQAILNLAVRGKLVQQGLTDEPASELLKRIALERNEQTKKRKSGLREVSEDGLRDVCLPTSWAMATLGELSLQLHYGYTASASKTEKDVRLLRITDIQDDRVNWDTVPGCEIDAKTLPKYALQAGDLLIARTGGTIGKTFLVADVPVKSVFASYLIRVQPARALSAPFVKLFCGSDIYWDQLREGSRGGGQPNVNGQTLGRMFVPLPPLAEQHRIVAKVDALMVLCDRLEAALTTADTTRARLLEALLHEALGSAATLVTEAAE